MKKIESLKSEKFKPLSPQQLKNLRGGMTVTTDPRPGYSHIDFQVGNTSYFCERDEYTTNGNGTWISARYYLDGAWHDIQL